MPAPTRRSFLKQTAFSLGAASLLSACRTAMTTAQGTYTNPVYAHSFPDPFVFRHEGAYYAVGTTGQGRTPDGRIFTLLKSQDLVNWQTLGGALTPPAGAAGADFWAPEVAYYNGLFYLYYSQGGGAINSKVGHQLQVATSKRPEGPYEKVAVLTDPNTSFTIDPHPFRDTDGTWYLFYARDFLDADNGYRPGTGLAMDRLVDMTRLAGESRTVMRARHDWTLFEANRLMPAYDNRTFAEWHTLEGPEMVLHAGKYYCFYSGANFLTDRYGVDYCVADRITGPYSDAGAEGGARVLHSVPGHVRGPGHHSHVVGPDGKTEYLAYHAWNEAMTERQLCLDVLRWLPEGPRCTPTYTPQPVPVER